jgi:hypothetical protein
MKVCKKQEDKGLSLDGDGEKEGKQGMLDVVEYQGSSAGSTDQGVPLFDEITKDVNEGNEKEEFQWVSSLVAGGVRVVCTWHLPLLAAKRATARSLSA